MMGKFIEIKSIKMENLSPVLTEIIQSGTDVRLTVTGNSMLPLFRNLADSVVLTRPDYARLKKYDIVLYVRDSGQYVLHRIVKRKGDVLSMNGDNQVVIESPIYVSQVVALVKGFYRGDRDYVPCSALKYRLYCLLWVNTVRIRPLMFKLYFKLGRLRSKLKKRRK